MVFELYSELYMLTCLGCIGRHLKLEGSQIQPKRTILDQFPYFVFFASVRIISSDPRLFLIFSTESLFSSSCMSEWLILPLRNFKRTCILRKPSAFSINLDVEGILDSLVDSWFDDIDIIQRWEIVQTILKAFSRESLSDLIQRGLASGDIKQSALFGIVKWYRQALLAAPWLPLDD